MPTAGTVTKYVYGLGLIGEEVNNSFKTYHFDYRGSTVAVTYATGTITDTFKYDTYGNIIGRTGTSDIIFCYNGRDGVITDKNGLYYMRARYYSPELRRFINADILHGEISDSTSLNRYAYVNGNPISFVDPLGMSKEDRSGNDGFNGYATPGIYYLENHNVHNVSTDSVDWDKIGKGALFATAGILTVIAVAATGGSCIAVVALAYSVVGTAGVTATVIGVAEIEEGFSNTNELKDYVGENTYGMLQGGAATVMLAAPNIIDYGTNVSICFVEGTPVLTDNGNQPIESIMVGDRVWSEDPDTQIKALKRVVQTFKNETKELVHIHINDDETVSTPEHPYYVINKGWVGAKNLSVGDAVVLQNGKTAFVDSVIYEKLDAPVSVYNFEVEDFHTYYVGSSAVLVHNMCAKKADIKQIEDVAKQLKMNKVERREFGDYIESYKTIVPNNHNFKYSELLELGKEFLGDDS